VPSERDLNLTITGEDLTRKATDSAGRNFDRLQRKVDGFTTSKPSAEVEKFSRLVTSNLKDGETGFQAVQRQIDETSKRLVTLRRDFAKTGNGGLFGDIKGAESDLKSLEHVLATMLGSSKGFDKGGIFKSLETEVEAGASSGWEKAGAFIASPPGIAVVAAALTGLTGVVAAAVTAGIGLGVVGGAAFIRRGDPQFAAALQGLKTDVSSVFTEASGGLEGPLIDAVQSFGRLIKKEEPALAGVFDAAAPAVAQIEHGVEKLATDFIPVLAKGAKSFSTAISDPNTLYFLKAAEDGVTKLFGAFVGHPQLIKDGFAVISGAIITTTAVLRILVATANAADKAFHFVTKFTGISNLFDTITKVQGGLLPATARDFDAVSTAMAGSGAAAQKAAPSWDDLNQAMSQTAATADSVHQQIADKILNTILSTDHATLSWYESLTNLKSALKDNHDALRITTKDGQANREAILGAVQANIQVYDSMIAAGSSAAVAADKYDQNYNALHKTLQEAGIAPKKIDGLIGAYKGVPHTVDTQIVLGDLDKTLNQINTLLSRMLAFDGSYTANLYVKTHVDDQYSQVNKALAHAHGGHALEAGLSWSPMPFANAQMGGAQPGMSQAARPTSLEASLTTNVYLDGRLLDRRIETVSTRVVARNNRDMRVGARD